LTDNTETADLYSYQNYWI